MSTLETFYHTRNLSAATTEELEALRKVAQVVKRYRTAVMQLRTARLMKGVAPDDVRRAELEIGSAEFELADALAMWEGNSI